MSAPPPSRPSWLTVTIASLSSVVAAVVVSRVWGPGTLIGAAVTPIIVAVVSESVRRPVERLPVATTRARASGPEEPTVVVAPASTGGRPRRWLLVGVAVGLLAFVIGATVLTTTELLAGGSVRGGGNETSILGGSTSTKQKTTTKTTTEPATTTKTETTTTTPPTTTTVTETTTAPTTATEPPATTGTTPTTTATTTTTTPTDGTPTPVVPSAP